ncbi:MAG: DUF2167 domain-containing protein [Blastocatellia bacterium]
MKSLLVLLLLVFSMTSVAADKAKPSPKKEKPSAKEAKQESQDMTGEKFEAQLKYQRGSIMIGNGLATLTVPDGFRYLNPEQSERLLVEAWGNPPGRKTLGMLFPSDVSPLSEDGWGVVIRYDEDGFVKDDDAEAIDYNDLLKQMKQDTIEANEEREKQGYEAVELIGWAAPPHYDKTSHKLYWAKELKFADLTENTLNYDIRVLGRKGVLSFNAVSSMRQLSGIRNRMQEVLGFVQFNAGNRYSDFNPSVDKFAAYGIGALIAGKVAAKAGLFKLLLGGLLALKKFIVIGVAVLIAFLPKLFQRRKAISSGDPATTSLNVD